MANRKNETISYNLQAKADFSQLIKSLNSVYDEIRSKADKTDILSIDKTLSKMNELQAKLEQSIKNGFSSPKELKDFYKLMDNLNTDASNLSAKFQSIHVKGLQTELKEASKNLKEVEASYRKVRSEAENVIKSQLTGVKKSKEYSKSLVNAAGDAEKLKQIQEDITKEIEKQIKAEKDSQSLARKSIDTEENNLNKQLKNRTSITQQTSLTSKNFKNADGSKISTDQWKLVRQAFSSAIEGSKKGSTALEKFKKQLEELGIEARNITNVKIQFENLNNTVFNPSSSINTGIEQTRDNISKLNAELLKSQNNQVNLEQNLNTVTGTLNSNETTAALQSVVAAEDDVTSAIQRRDSAEDALEKNKTPERIDEINEKLKEQKERTEEVKEETTKMSESQQAFDNFTNSLQNSVKQILSITTSWRLFRQMVSQTFEDVKELDKSFAQIAMVTSYEVSDLWGRYEEYAQLANRLGQSTQSVVEASGLYYQQGLDTAEVMELTEQTMKLATLAGLDFKEATAQMTAAIRGFHMEMSEGQRVTDVYAEVAAHAAVDVKGLSDAMSATASIANSAGMQFETTTAMLATMAEVTQEAPKNLGTALKTVIARFTELKENVAGTADSEFDDLDYNKVDKALKTVGVQLKDTTGQFRNLDDVFLDLGKKWNTLDRNSQRYIATIAAGSRQQSRFIALMENYERTMQLVDVAQNSAGKSQQQFAKFADSTEYKLNKLKNTFEQVRISLTGKGVFDTLIESATEFAERLQGIDFTKILMIAPIALTLGRTMAKQWINGLSDGLQKGRGLIGKGLGSLFTGGNKKTTIELDADSKKIKKELLDIEQKKEKLKTDFKDFKIETSDKRNQLVKELGKAERSAAQVKKEIEEIDQNTNLTGDQKNSIIEFKQNQLKELENQIKTVDAELQDLGDTDNDYKGAINQLDEEQKNKKKEKWDNFKTSSIKKFSDGIGSALGEGIATAAMMAFTGTFNWSEIFTTTAVQSGISAVTTALTGNWQMALGQAAVAGLSWGIKKFADDIEETNEKQKLAANGVYRWQKRIEELEDAQEEYNRKLDEANQKYDEAKKSYDSIQSAKQTYEELSKKVLLTEEEQNNLNTATETLLEYMPNLLAGYDAQGKAILKSGTAYDELIAKQKESLILATKEQNEAEKRAKIGEMNTLIAQREQSKEKKFQIKELQNGFEVLNTSPWFDSIDTFSLKDILNPQRFSNLSNYGWDREETYENALEALEEENSMFVNLVKETAEEMSNKTFSTIAEANEWISETTEDEDISMYVKFGEKLQEKIKELDASDFDPEEYDKYIKSLSDLYLSTAKNDIELFFLQNPKIEQYSDEKQKLLQEVINKTLISSEDIDKLIKENTINGEVDEKALNKGYQKLLDSLLNDDALKETEKLSDNQVAQIGELVSKIYTEPIEKLKEEADKLNLTGDIKKYVDTLISEASTSWQDSYNNIAEVFGAGFENSQLSQVLQNSGAEGAKAFENSFAQFDTNEAARIFITNLSKNLEKYSGEIPNEAISYLINYDWSTVELTDLSNVKQAFLEYCDTIEGGVDNAEQLWEDYKNYLLQYNVLQTPTLLTIEDLEEQISTSLKDKVEASSGLATAVEKQLTNGVLNFSESQSFKEACEKIGLTASDYLSYGIDGTITLDTEALKKGVEAQKLSEAEVLEEVKNQLIAKRDQLETELAIFDAAGSILTEEETRRDLAISIADAYWDAAQAMAAMNPDKVKLGNRQTIRFENVTGTDVSAQRAALEEQIEQITDTINHLSPDSAEYKAFLSEYEAAYAEIVKNITDKEEAAAKQAKENAEAATEAYENWEKQVKTVNEKIEALNETIRGTEYFDSGIDSMYNYTTALERVTKAADDAKDVLEDLQDTDNASESMDKYLKAIHNEAAISEAEARVYAQAITNGQKVIDEKLTKEIEKINSAAQARAAETGETVPLMSTDTSGLYKLVGDRYQIDLDRLNNLSMNDDIKKMIADELKSWNDNLDKIEELEKKRRDRIKEYQKLQKDALSNVVNLEEEMKNTLKEKYEQEIEDVENKYTAMAEADNEYVDALEEAIKKQRELRDRENQWNDLANKERKLSLMQRDTSGSNRVETRQLENEVQEDRQELLDNSVDDIIDGLKEMYELQKESREAEIEYRKALIDEGMLMREVTAALANIDTADDLVAWFYENTANLSDMSEEQIKLEEMGWRDLFDAKTVYMETSQADFDKALLVTEADIAQVVNETSENLTTKADWTLGKIGDSVSEAIKKAQEDLETARKDLQEKWEAYLNALEKTAKDAANQSSGSKQKYTNETAQYYYNTAKHGVTRTSARLLNENEVVTGVKDVTQNYSNPTAQSYYDRTRNNESSAPKNINTDIGNWSQIRAQISYQKIIDKISKSNDLGNYKSLEELGLSTTTLKDFLHFLDAKGYGYKYWSKDQTIQIDKKNSNILSPYRSTPTYSNVSNSISSGKFAKGGLVDFTGPAWVDGTKRAPEAFLSAEDTKRIGEAAKLLATSPLFNNTSWEKNDITNNTVGDTVIDIHVNIENVSSDYDVDQAIERVKQDIVDAAKYTGSNVILNKRV